MLGCIDDVPVLSHMRLMRALARGYIRVIMYLGMYKAALMISADSIIHIYLTVIRRRRGDYRGIFTETKSR